METVRNAADPADDGGVRRQALRLRAYRDGMEIYGRAASKDKELVVVEGWSHYDLCDRPEPTGIALTRVIPFLKQHLGEVAVARDAKAAA